MAGLRHSVHAIGLKQLSDAARRTPTLVSCDGARGFDEEASRWDRSPSSGEVEGPTSGSGSRLLELPLIRTAATGVRESGVPCR